MLAGLAITMEQASGFSSVALGLRGIECLNLRWSPAS